MSGLGDKIREIVNDTVRTLGYTLVEVKFFTEKNGHKLLKVVIYKPDKDITLDDCAEVSGVLSRRLDVEDLISSSYKLIVESPGADRKLKSMNELEIFKGREMEFYVRNYKELNLKKSKLIGKLKEINKNTNELLFMLEDGNTIKLNYSRLNGIKLYFDIKKYLKSGGH